MILYSPLSSVVVVRTFSIRAGLDASTMTPGRTAPEASFAVPARAPLLVTLCAVSGSSRSAAPKPQQLTLWSGIAAEFTNDLIRRFNSALPQTHIDLHTTSGGVVVVSAVDGGQGQLGLAQSDVVYLA